MKRGLLVVIFLVAGCGARNSSAAITALTITTAYPQRYGWDELMYRAAQRTLAVASGIHTDEFYLGPENLVSMPIDDLRWVQRHGGMANVMYSSDAPLVVTVHVEFADEPPTDARFVTFSFPGEAAQLVRVQNWWATFASMVAERRLPLWQARLRDAIVPDRVAILRAKIPYGSSFVSTYTLTVVRDGRAWITVPVHAHLGRGGGIVHAQTHITQPALREIELSALRLRPSAPVLGENNPGVHVTITTPDDRFQADGSDDCGFAIFAAHVTQFVRDADWQPKVPWQ